MQVRFTAAPPPYSPLARCSRRASRGVQLLKGLVTFALLGWVSSIGPAMAEESAPAKEDIRELKLRHWHPRSMLLTPETKLDKGKFPVVDMHNHLGDGRDFLTPEKVKEYLTEMDAAGVRTVINLDGNRKGKFEETIELLDKAHPGRFMTFALLDFTDIDDANWGQREADRLEARFKAGAKGLKFHKSLGLDYRYRSGQLMPVDDPKLDLVWKVCAKYNRPVMIHSADPAAFFTPLDQNNERWHELNEHPDWAFFGAQFPKREELLKQFIHVVEQNPETKFIGAHCGNNAEDLETVGRWLDTYPNLYVDIDARISELGRQPYTARRFLIKYQDRIFFGTDTRPKREAFRIYYRFLETEDEYFDCAASHHLQGFWMIYGVHLPDEVLEKIYYKNADRIFSEPTPKKVSVQGPLPEIHVARTADFQVTGSGEQPEWQQAQSLSLATQKPNAPPYTTTVKLLYSDRGLYARMEGTDTLLSATQTEDFADLWHEDVFEMFLWPDMRQPLYLEYELSPLSKELVLLIPNLNGNLKGWRPWHYEGERKIQKAVRIIGGEAQPGQAIQGWQAEIFVPFALFEPLGNLPPTAGSKWRANFFRVDCDHQQKFGWKWSEAGSYYHNMDRFGTLIFD